MPRSVVVRLVERDHPDTPPVCHYCRRDLDLAADFANDRWAPSADHIVPRSVGGPDALWNRVLACRLCNHRKSSWGPSCRCRICHAAVVECQRLGVRVPEPRPANRRERGRLRQRPFANLADLLTAAGSPGKLTGVREGQPAASEEDSMATASPGRRIVIEQLARAVDDENFTYTPADWAALDALLAGLQVRRAAFDDVLEALQGLRDADDFHTYLDKYEVNLNANPWHPHDRFADALDHAAKAAA